MLCQCPLFIPSNNKHLYPYVHDGDIEIISLNYK